MEIIIGHEEIKEAIEAHLSGKFGQVLFVSDIQVARLKNGELKATVKADFSDSEKANTTGGEK